MILFLNEAAAVNDGLDAEPSFFVALSVRSEMGRIENLAVFDDFQPCRLQGTSSGKVLRAGSVNTSLGY